MAEIFTEWNKGELDSYLIEITADILGRKDDDGTWQQSSNAPTTKTASFKFKVPGKFTQSSTYKVYYPGKYGNKDQVTISASQSQSEPNTTDHFGESGLLGLLLGLDFHSYQGSKPYRCCFL